MKEGTGTTASGHSGPGIVLGAPSVTITAGAAEAHPEGLAGTRLRAFRSLKSRDFRYLWLGQITNSLGVWMEMVARPLLVLLLTDNPIHLGFVLAARTIPQLFVGFFGGTFADRYNRRIILIFSKSGASATNLSLALLIISGNVELWHVYATAVAKSFFNSFDQPARQALIPSLVRPEQVLNAVAFNSSTMAAVRIGGAALAGLLIATAGIGVTFLVSGVCIAVAVLFSALMRAPTRIVRAADSHSLASNAFQGFKYVWQDPPIRNLLFLAISWFALGMSYMQVFAPLLAKQVMDIGDQGYGYLIAMAGAGSLVGGLLVASQVRVKSRGRLLPLIMGASGALLILFAVASNLDWIYLAFGVIALVGACQTLFMSLVNSALMQFARDEMRGRVFGVHSMDRAMTSGGAAAAGFLAAGVGPQWGQAIFGGLIITLALGWVLFGRTLRLVD